MRIATLKHYILFNETIIQKNVAQARKTGDLSAVIANVYANPYDVFMVGTSLGSLDDARTDPTHHNDKRTHPDKKTPVYELTYGEVRFMEDFSLSALNDRARMIMRIKDDKNALYIIDERDERLAQARKKNDLEAPVLSTWKPRKKLGKKRAPMLYGTAALPYEKAILHPSFDMTKTIAVKDKKPLCTVQFKDVKNFTFLSPKRFERVFQRKIQENKSGKVDGRHFIVLDPIEAAQNMADAEAKKNPQAHVCFIYLNNKNKFCVGTRLYTNAETIQYFSKKMDDNRTARDNQQPILSLPYEIAEKAKEPSYHGLTSVVRKWFKFHDVTHRNYKEKFAAGISSNFPPPIVRRPKRGRPPKTFFLNQDFPLLEPAPLPEVYFSLSTANKSRKKENEIADHRYAFSMPIIRPTLS